jgi:hypothetical protein
VIATEEVTNRIEERVIEVALTFTRERPIRVCEKTRFGGSCLPF